MHMQFRVIKDDGLIFKRDFVEPTLSHLGALTGIAVLEFLSKHPGVSLLDKEVVMIWRDASSD